MNCDRIEELMPRYIEDALSEDERSAVESHVSSCRRCRESLGAFTELESSLLELKAAVPSWKTTEARLTRGLGIEKRRAFPGSVFNAPFAAGLTFIALGIALFLKGNVLFPAMQSLGWRFADSFNGLTQSLSRLFEEAAGLNPVLLLSTYGFLTLALIWAAGMLVLRFGRK